VTSFMPLRENREEREGEGFSLHIRKQIKMQRISDRIPAAPHAVKGLSKEKRVEPIIRARKKLRKERISLRRRKRETETVHKLKEAQSKKICSRESVGENDQEGRAKHDQLSQKLGGRSRKTERQKPIPWSQRTRRRVWLGGGGKTIPCVARRPGEGNRCKVGQKSTKIGVVKHEFREERL